jgi:hypothetical protein
LALQFDAAAQRVSPEDIKSIQREEVAPWLIALPALFDTKVRKYCEIRVVRMCRTGNLLCCWDDYYCTVGKPKRVLVLTCCVVRDAGNLPAGHPVEESFHQVRINL